MKSFVPELINRIENKAITLALCLYVCILLTVAVSADPSSQQEQELLLLDALSKRQPNYSNYGTSNTLMDMLGRSNFLSFFFFFIYLSLCLSKV